MSGAGVGGVFEDLRGGGGLEQTVERLQGGLDLERGDLVRFALVEDGSGSRWLVAVVHHLAVDGVSWRILLEDLGLAYRQLSAGEAVRLPAKTTAFVQWARGLVEFTRSDALKTERDWWLSVGDAPSLPRDHCLGDNDERSAQSVSVSLDEHDTGVLLREASSVYRAQAHDLLLASLVEVVSSWSGRSWVWLTLEGHGREPLWDGLDLTRTVGWFTTRFPVRLGGKDIQGARLLGEVKDQLRAIPRGGAGYGLLRYLGEEPTRRLLGARAEPEMAFNYLGQFDQVLDSPLFASAPNLFDERLGASRDPGAKRANALEIIAAVVDGRLQITWVYSRNLHHHNTIHTLAHQHLDKLNTLLHESTSNANHALTPSDFPLANLNPQTLKTLVERVERTARS
jgi:non-ribosomal peptide synthase protein (TIGR01720 family)